jgi:hypothetical protein
MALFCKGTLPHLPSSKLMTCKVILQVLEGYIFLGTVQELGSRIAGAFAAAAGDAARHVVRSVVLTRPGLEDRARPGMTLQEMVRGVPSDLFRTCLARVSAPEVLYAPSSIHVRVLGRIDIRGSVSYQESLLMTALIW